ncbi:TPA: hypothetical protein I1606_001909 [Staphylococcus pseudintermedius]|uniref:hypothetical protein n=1 Tax=Staphylococcus pseudintermedius TaxID=283734 RepID=UPI001A019290|nr:hypothetical protein [Staphylococcus pseudintermedius]EGQ2764680.1 hypothetical protein [Staphylococcus pseudintermedius]EIT1003236.1 hypothetical protein [Staphylococcus pseudintermedius]EKI4483084.1 hypothetical protein [Staphylococcus pseudintermedius]EKO1101649.1 hypothetical protein [Staphylococcus pseudintermedius]EKS1591090.1 hypothetical protein [Staphylococcus pseudintermedius]
MLRELDVIYSTSRVDSCIDNSSMEGFWGAIKAEMYYLKNYDRIASKNLKETL